MKDMRTVVVNLSTEGILRLLGFGLLIYFLFTMKDVVLVILAAIVIASAIEPITQWFVRHRIHRLASVILIYLIMGAVLSGIIFFFVPTLLSETVVYLQNLPENLKIGDLFGGGGDVSVLRTSSLSSFEAAFPVRDVVSDLNIIINRTGEGFFKTASVVFGGAISFALIVVISFYLAVQEDGVGNFLRVILPVKYHAYVMDLWKRSQQKIGYWLQGQLFLGVLIGVLVYMGLMIIGIERAFLLATLAAIFEIIPVFGPILSAIPAIAAGISQSGVGLGLWVAGLYIIIQQFENHLIYPLVVKKIVGVSPIIVILALIIGGKLGGVLGALIAVPLSAAIMEYVHDVQKSKGLPTDEPPGLVVPGSVK